MCVNEINGRVRFLGNDKIRQLRACLVQLLPSQKQFSTVPKAILAKNNVFGLAFQNCFYPPKAIRNSSQKQRVWFGFSELLLSSKSNSP
jgi:hypothetical protein